MKNLEEYENWCQLATIEELLLSTKSIFQEIKQACNKAKAKIKQIFKRKRLQPMGVKTTYPLSYDRNAAACPQDTMSFKKAFDRWHFYFLKGLKPKIHFLHELEAV